MRGGWEADATNKYEYLLFRLYKAGEGKGYIPVSGTVNTIHIPARSSSPKTSSFSIDPSTTKEIFRVDGIGKIKFLALAMEGIDDAYIIVFIDVDEESVTGFGITQAIYTLGDAAGFGGDVMHFTRIDDTNKKYCIVFNDAFSFKNYFAVRIKNAHSTDSLTGRYICIVETIT